jgi:16S rRNA processing protein RimM
MNPYPPDPWIIVGKIGRTVGLEGAVRVWPEGDLFELFEKEVPLAVYLPREERTESLVPLKAREDAHGWVVLWEGYPTREATLLLRNNWLVARRENLPEPLEDEVYWSDLMGAGVETREQRYLGVVKEYIESGANMVVEVERPDGSRFLIPLTAQVDASFEKGSLAGERALLKVTLPPGLEEATEVIRTESEKVNERRPRGPRNRHSVSRQVQDRAPSAESSPNELGGGT